ncbi:MTH1187 family thiamine-binding protein [Tindallia californiensis]|uniref:Uncharacterized protein, MTH1187 family n=1 Tax=Tindallia californiensis TaxID=159292 RepID=A0A1H3KEP4_9FIRM|nr:MTH1187 family thiamine-binding protein [Tindallia californiensis]SDY50479.1 uncharacterized protein, MTH1187 family [Tindallia californiensis]
MAIVEATITPLGTASTSISQYVANCHKVLNHYPEIKYQLTPMGTIFEGELSTILQVIEKMHEVPFTSGAQRVSTSIKIDDRRDKQATMSEKLRSVQEKW